MFIFPLFNPYLNKTQEKPVPIYVRNVVSNCSTNCSKLLHDYIKCVNDDETCCAELYQKYLKCNDQVKNN